MDFRKLITIVQERNTKSKKPDEKFDAKAVAAEIKDSVEGLGTDLDQLYTALGKVKTQEQWLSILKIYPRVIADIEDDVSDSELVKVKNILRKNGVAFDFDDMQSAKSDGQPDDSDDSAEPEEKADPAEELKKHLATLKQKKAEKAAAEAAAKEKEEAERAAEQSKSISVSDNGLSYDTLIEKFKSGEHPLSKKLNAAVEVGHTGDATALLQIAVPKELETSLMGSDKIKEFLVKKEAEKMAPEIQKILVDYEANARGVEPTGDTTSTLEAIVKKLKV